QKLSLPPWHQGDTGGEKTAFSATSPHFNAEEAYSAHMPEHLRCDACRVIAFQVSPAPQALGPTQRRIKI
uniref:Uncharacterized protein n=1 Tax=Terrapene triunguis TaxID=2587831 RepID=A0A674K2K0_9SAUR